MFAEQQAAQQERESAPAAAEPPRTRKVGMRSAMTMSPDASSVFDVFARLARRGLGGTAEDGRQFVSWIHDQDFTGAVWLQACDCAISLV